MILDFLDCYRGLGGKGSKSKRSKAQKAVAGGMSIENAAKEYGLTGNETMMLRAAVKKAESRDAEQKPKGQASKSGNPSLPEGTRVIEQGFKTEYASEIGGQKVSLTITQQDPGRRSHGEIAFRIGDSYSREGKLQGRDADRAAIRVMKQAKYDAANRPEGYIMSTRAFKEDGFGKNRAQIYERFGFSPPTKVGDPQYAIVKNGKLQPYKPKGRAPTLTPDFDEF